MGRFEIKDDFYLDGKAFKIISGAFHYFRTVPEYWRDRMEKWKAMGGNTVETYIPWNLHEPKKGQFCFAGLLDVVKFIQTAQELGLYVIIRPSPYICAEWEFGGLPAWLLAEDGMKLRVSYPPFLRHVEEYYQVLLPLIIPYQIDQGGPVILMQVENEYGYYANDKAYMEAVKKMMLDNGVTVPLVTSDGPFPENLNGGRIAGALPTGNFGSRTEERFKVLAKYTQGGPLMCTEFWVGWFDHWGNGGHMRGNLEESVKDLDQMLEQGHVNIYMFEGGTNFGFMNGSNYYDELTPDVTSYDYDGVLTEDGQITEKYRRYREVIGKYTELPVMEFTTKISRREYGTLKVRDKVSLFSVLEDISSPVFSPFPQSMERLGQSYGYILYHTALETEESIQKLRLWGAGDRANILVNHKPLITLYDKELKREQEVNCSLEQEVNFPSGQEVDCCCEQEADGTLENGAHCCRKNEGEVSRNKECSAARPVMDILVENMGRVNFGPRMEHQRKGIDQCVQINGHMHNNWEQYPLPLDHVERIDFSKEYMENTPAFYRFVFTVEEPGDTFLDFEGWGKGCAFVNGFHIGRFWEIGPQKRLYIPGPLLKTGENEIILFETDGKSRESISLKGEPDIG